MKKVEILFTMMKDGSKIPLETMLNQLNVTQGSVMCLISALRNDFGAEIETERDGRKVLSYQLTNASDVKLPTKSVKTAKPKATKVIATKVKTSVSRKNNLVEKDEIPTIDVEEVNNDLELASLKAEWGLSESYSE